MATEILSEAAKVVFLFWVLATSAGPGYPGPYPSPEPTSTPISVTPDPVYGVTGVTVSDTAASRDSVWPTVIGGVVVAAAAFAMGMVALVEIWTVLRGGRQQRGEK